MANPFKNIFQGVSSFFARTNQTARKYIEFVGDFISADNKRREFLRFRESRQYQRALNNMNRQNVNRLVDEKLRVKHYGGGTKKYRYLFGMESTNQITGEKEHQKISYISDTRISVNEAMKEMFTQLKESQMESGIQVGEERVLTFEAEIERITTLF